PSMCWRPVAPQRCTPGSSNPWSSRSSTRKRGRCCTGFPASRSAGWTCRGQRSTRRTWSRRTCGRRISAARACSEPASAAPGYGVVTAADGREALECLADRRLPSLILLDLSMPEMDGWAFRIEQMKDPRLAAIPVVICTAMYDPAPAAEMAKADGYLAKPYDL